MAKWRLCESLKILQKQLNTAFPSRSTISDGSIGNTEHSARKSSHNPDEHGAVRAIDITHNVIKGIDCQMLLQTLLAKPDKRIWYIIFDRKIYNRKDNFSPKVYSGANAHKQHLHVSVSDTPALYDDASDWNLKFDFIEKPTGEVSPKFVELKKGDQGEAVLAMQTKLVLLGYLRDSDGIFGEWTAKAVAAFQRDSGLREDSIAGKNTLAELDKHI